MSNFEYYLQDIASDICCPNDPVDNSDFVDVKDYVLDIMRMEDSYFRYICQNDILFGSAAHNVRLYNDDEFDVLMELRFPAHNRIKQVDLKDRPGFMYLDFSNACFDTMVTNTLTSKVQKLMSQSSLKSWLDSTFRAALKNYGNIFDTGYERYTLRYIWRGITYTIYAKSPSRSFSIDFVPAVKIVRNSHNANTWHAIPKQRAGPGNTPNFTFMLSNSQGELQHVSRCGQTMRDALRLLQALRNSKDLPKLRCYHMVTVAIWMARRIGHSTISNMFVSDAFLMLLSDLCDAFIDGHLSHVWDSRMNLLGDLKPAEMSRYTDVLCSAYNTLKSYPHQSSLSFERCQGHFQ
ncbi:uncharacterized protein LOC117785860 [Drosophila innubila]|uniref:uncharacterized protein LOC117785860 n=1 Tax=Drosophila innubila TaxID=198719 RepID=UPI00148D5428|nr:uncharacterized protein LOC117785860 [Drosophila innubila]